MHTAAEDDGDVKMPQCCCFTLAKQSLLVQSPSCVWLFVTPRTAAQQASLSLTIFLSLLKFTSIEPVMPSNHLILCHPLLLLPSIFPGIRVFPNELAVHITWPKYCPFNEYSGLISFKMTSLISLFLGTLRSPPQQHSLGASLYQHLACSEMM